MSKDIVGAYALQLRSLQQDAVALIDDQVLTDALNKRFSAAKLWKLIKSKVQDIYEIAFQYGKWQVEEVILIFARRGQEPPKANPKKPVKAIKRLSTDILYSYFVQYATIEIESTRKKIQWWLRFATLKGKTIDEAHNAPTNLHRETKLLNDLRWALVFFLQDVKNYAEIDGRDKAEKDWLKNG